MSRHRQLDTRFWEDFYISELDPIEKLLFLYFILNSRTALCGAYEMPLSIVAGETGIDKDMVRKIVERFANDNKMKLVEGFILIRNYGKYISPNPSIMVGIEREKCSLPEHIKDMVDTYCIQSGYSLGTEPTQRVYIPKPKPKPKRLRDNTPIVPKGTKKNEENNIQKLEESNELYVFWEEKVAPITNFPEKNKSACELLVSKHGIDLCRKMVDMVVALHADPFGKPKVHSPSSLAYNWDRVYIYGKSRFTQEISKPKTFSVYS